MECFQVLNIRNNADYVKFGQALAIISYASTPVLVLQRIRAEAKAEARKASN